jgi:hypothetical protein
VHALSPQILRKHDKYSRTHATHQHAHTLTCSVTPLYCPSAMKPSRGMYACDRAITHAHDHDHDTCACTYTLSPVVSVGHSSRRRRQACAPTAAPLSRGVRCCADMLRCVVCVKTCRATRVITCAPAVVGMRLPSSKPFVAYRAYSRHTHSNNNAPLRHRALAASRGRPRRDSTDTHTTGNTQERRGKRSETRPHVPART